MIQKMHYLPAEQIVRDEIYKEKIEIRRLKRSVTRKSGSQFFTSSFIRFLKVR
jgi:hypothetical protein